MDREKFPPAGRVIKPGAAQLGVSICCLCQHSRFDSSGSCGNAQESGLSDALDLKLTETIRRAACLRYERYGIDLYGRCESPIELLMGVAIRETLLSGALFLHRSDASSLDEMRSFITEQHIIAAPQVSCGPYTVDFLLRIGTGESARFVAVECDGHAYHDKTPDQAARDKSRDRYLASNGLVVLRFTGSEIWADPLACADEAMGVLLECASETARAARATAA